MESLQVPLNESFKEVTAFQHALKEFNPTHEPIGNIFQHGKKVTSKDFTAP